MVEALRAVHSDYSVLLRRHWLRIRRLVVI